MEINKFINNLKEKIYQEVGSDELDENIKGVSTFEEVGFLTRDKGLVVQMEDGSEFQVTIRKSEEEN